MHFFAVWRYRQFHISLIFGWLALSILIGLIIGKAWPGLLHVLWVVAALSMLPMIVKQRRWWSIGLAIIAGISIGWQRGSNEMSALSQYQPWYERTINVQGVISDDPQPGTRSGTQFSLQSIEIENKALAGRVYVTTASHVDVKRGDRIMLMGKLRTGFGSYQASMGYAKLLQTNSGTNPIRDIRDSFSTGVRKTVVEPEASLGVGFVVGQRSALSPELDDQLKAVGLTHIVVASGYNLTILVRFARRLFARYSRYLALSSSLALVFAFIAFSGLTPSMVRAGLVTILSLVAWYYGRRFHPLLLILFVAAATAYWDPVFVWGDIGWYLSFLAFIGVLIVSPLMMHRLYGERKPGAIAQLCMETIAAQLMTLPLILFAFERLPVLSFFANILVAPIIPFAMLATTIAGIAGMVSSTVLGWLGLPATILIGYAVAVVEYLSSIEWAQIAFSIGAPILATMYAIIMIVLFVWWYRTKHNFRAQSIVD